MELTTKQAEQLHSQLVEAERLAAQGQLPQARALCERTLATCPGHPDAHQILGLICQQENNPGEAVKNFRKSLERFPDQPQLWLRVGYLLSQLKDVGAARAAFYESLKRNPANGYALRYLAELAESGDVPALLDRCEDALADPTLKDAAQKLPALEAMAVLHQKAGNVFLAEIYRAFSAMLKCQMAGEPPLQGANYGPAEREVIKAAILRAHDYLKADNIFRVNKLCTQLLERFPDQPDALQLLGVAATANFRHREAEAHYRKSLRAAPAQPRVWHLLASVLLADRRPRECRDALVAALALDPNEVEALNALAMLSVGEGSFARAKAYLARALATRPDFVPSYGLMLQIKGFTPDAAFLANLERLAADPATLNDHAVAANYALARHHEKKGPPEKFESCIRTANRLQAGQPARRLNPLPAALNLSKQALDAKILNDAAPPAVKKLTPIFIVGLPRSGTTLVEQILGCHPQIFPGDELPTLIRDLVLPLEEKTGKNYPLGLKDLAADDLASLAVGYQDAMRVYSETHPFMTDKKFDNLFYLGIVRKALPWAKVIWLRRNVMDNAFSIYTNHFSSAVGYAHDQKELATFFRMCLEARELWERLMPEFILDVHYETLVTNPEAEIRRMLDFIGLPFDPACLKFHESKRPALTLSITQVQQPLYTSSIGRWKKYPGLLAEFRAEMADLIDADGYLKG